MLKNKQQNDLIKIITKESFFLFFFLKPSPVCLITSQQKCWNASSRQMACLPLYKNAQSHVEMTAPSRFGPSLHPAPQTVKQPEVDGDSSQVRCAFHFLASDKGCTPKPAKENGSSRRTRNCIGPLLFPALP